MLTVDLPTKELERLAKAVDASGRKLPQQVAIAVNATAKKTRSEISKDIRKELNAKKKAVDKALVTGPRATRQRTGTTVTVAKGRRIPIKEFGARQTKAGVSYKISKNKGRSLARGAFMGPKPGAVAARLGGHAFKRMGPQRLPIKKLYGPSPWGVFRGQRLTRPTMSKVSRELRKQLERRIRFNVLKASGAI